MSKNKYFAVAREMSREIVERQRLAMVCVREGGGRHIRNFAAHRILQKPGAENVSSAKSVCMRAHLLLMAD